MKDKWEVAKHGTSYIDTSSPIICPECGNLIEKIYTSSLSKESPLYFFETFKDTWTEENCKCPECGCELIRKTNFNREVDWISLFAVIITVLFIIDILLLIIFGITFVISPTDFTLIGLGITFLIFIIAMIFLATI